MIFLWEYFFARRDVRDSLPAPPIYIIELTIEHITGKRVEEK